MSKKDLDELYKIRLQAIPTFQKYNIEESRHGESNDARKFSQ